MYISKKNRPAKRVLIKTPCPAGQGVKVSKCQIASLFKVSILKATHRESVRPVAAAHAGTAAEEVQVPRIGTTYGT